MKKLLISLLAAFQLLIPVAAHAYFASDFLYMRTPVQTPQYIQDPSLDFLPGWPDWIGRLNLFSKFLYGQEYQKLTTVQQQKVEQLSRDWPAWIGVPFFLKR